ncbi:putative lrr receptor-like serine/threonine-protein kinase [Quercus suber]|uniref:non-specific serine/threonine protein kinase n=1 Tax=Quercus suber TaxID=58331 RepID=A0AAW0LG51_QUESU
MAGSSPLLVYAFCAACLFCQLFELAQAQNRTDPAEVAALNTIFQKWGISANSNQWNISGEPCSGAAIDSTSFDDTKFNPLIKCDCSSNSNSTCHITQLKVYALNVVGVIPDELWTLTFLFNLSFGINALSGTLPKELGNLTELKVLSFSTNNFTGSLPSDLGKLVKLEELYFDSSGVSGAIPLTFANLKSLVKVWASDTELTGQIPDFIGNWSKLTTLRFEGNSLEGPIPSAFSNLTSLTELRISDLSNGSSSLAFIQNMKSLSILVLRNINISDSIPSNIGEYQKLSQLDLSFNNITGQIPNALFNLSSLSYLFLGNNKLNGIVPAQKSGSLLNIDLSYNNLQGSFPSWVSEQNLQLNLVANNFTIESSNSSVLPSGLSCLQQDFPCNRDSEFAVKCGGPQITSSNGIVYERDNETLGPATYYVVDTDRWAVSNVGYFSGTKNAQYTSFSSSQFTSLDSELFQTTRLSASSLRYYGLGLENGNYTVSLQFAEIAFVNTNTWQSLGRRVFDIYIQGNLVLKDFDIRKEAGGASFVAVPKEYNNVQVSENYLEIHLFWAGKGTCCVPAQGTYGPSISAISATPEFTPTVSNIPPSTSSNKNRTGLIVGVVVGVGVLSFLAVFVVFYIVRRRKPPTNDDEGKRTLNLDWSMRFDICLGVARGLAYLHEESRLRIVHRDVKASNILLDSDLIPKISDFGLAKLYDDKKTHISTRVAGTIGYLAPEYAMRGHLTEKADVFAFGVVALELVSGRPNSDSSLEEEKIYLLEWAWQLHENNREVDLADSKLSEFNEEEVKRLIGVSLLCTQASPTLRPSMSRVVAMLSGDIEVSTVTSRPGYLTDWKYNDITSVTSEVAIDTSCFNSSSANTNMVGDVGNSPADASEPMLGDTIEKGR